MDTVGKEQAVRDGKPYRQGVDRPPPGSRVVMRDGTNYNVAEDGSFRHTGDVIRVNKAEKKKLKKLRRHERNKRAGMDQSG